ncbi:aromatic ring-hydroxylating dioxygenase subunit alpha [Streptomyces sp. NPDC094472]|uniref:aromatic ring-hydroxylating dioxygenase subunit alpha n=1 Tax=Streptomyces sp. NPDC094472 TaxID=3155080 RepID=UPI00331B3A8B
MTSTPKERRDVTPGSFVRGDGAEVGIAAFHDEDVYKAELEKVFAKCWLFLGHETQLRSPGDYISTRMGEDEVVVTRNSSGKIRAFLNSCRHRGPKLCRADQGNSQALRCPYHGWTYDLDGNLIGVPRLQTAYHGELDRTSIKLIEVAKLGIVHGLIFATWDPHAPSLHEYLGDFMPYLDLMLGRSENGFEAIGGVHKWQIETNWKIPAENFSGDQYHLSSTHASSVEVGLRNRVTEYGHTIHVDGGHGFTREKGGAQQGTEAVTAYTAHLRKVQERIGQDKPELVEFVPVGVGSIFPNLSFMDSMRFLTLRQWQPVGPHRIDVNSWCLVDSSLPDDLKDAAMRQYILSFGPSGMFEQDDGEIWTSISEATRGVVAQRYSFNYTMGLGHEVSVKERTGATLPGVMGEAFITEANQRSFYRYWRQLMEQ